MGYSQNPEKDLTASWKFLKIARKNWYEKDVYPLCSKIYNFTVEMLQMILSAFKSGSPDKLKSLMSSDLIYRMLQLLVYRLCIKIMVYLIAFYLMGYMYIPLWLRLTPLGVFFMKLLWRSTRRIKEEFKLAQKNEEVYNITCAILSKDILLDMDAFEK